MIYSTVLLDLSNEVGRCGERFPRRPEDAASDLPRLKRRAMRHPAVPMCPSFCLYRRNLSECQQGWLWLCSAQLCSFHLCGTRLFLSQVFPPPIELKFCTNVQDTWLQCKQLSTGICLFLPSSYTRLIQCNEILTFWFVQSSQVEQHVNVEYAISLQKIRDAVFGSGLLKIPFPLNPHHNQHI